MSVLQPQHGKVSKTAAGATQSPQYNKSPFRYIDFSNIECQEPIQLIQEPPNNSAETDRPTVPEMRYGLRLNDCELKNLHGIAELAARFFQPEQLDVLDLRNNRLENIAGLELFKNLKFLYLHGNELADIQALSFLDGWGLEVLTLHGNPLSLVVNYRAFFVQRLPALRQFDFCCITRNERFWAQQAQVDVNKVKQNVILQRMKTRGQVEEYRSRVKAEQAETRQRYEQRQREKEEQQQREEMEARRAQRRQ